MLHEHLAEIREGFADVDGAVTKMLVTHHPLFSQNGETRSTAHGAEAAVQQLAASGVRLLLAGHEHRPYSGAAGIDYLDRDRSILIVQAGTAVSTRLRGAPNSFNLLDIDGSRIECTPQLWDVGAFRPGECSAFAFSDGQWRALTRSVSPP